MLMPTAIQRFDNSLTKRIQALGPDWLGFFRQMTLVSQPILALGVAAAIAYYGEYMHDWRLMLAGMIAGASLLLASAFKFVLRRKRPATHYARSMFIKTYSFPSGHAAASASCLGLLVYLLIASGSMIAMVAGILLLPIIIGIGASRVYLGAHFPTDILGGWLLGGIGLGFSIWALYL